MGDNTAAFEDRVKYMTDKVSASFSALFSLHYATATCCSSNAPIYVSQGVLTHLTMPGSHHLHMDPDTEPAVSRQITDFLQAE